MPVLILLFLVTCHCQIVPPSLISVANKLGITRPLFLYNHFASPMPSSLLTLCGNGVLNKKEDYLTLGSPVPGNSVDEECDDGNRIDGDGCSADCMDVDTLVSHCKVSNVGRLKYIAMDAVTGTLYLATMSGVIQRMDVSMNGVTVTEVAAQDVQSMMVYNSSIYTYANNQLLWQGQTLQAAN